MKKIFLACSTLALIISCATNPLTGKKQLALSSEAELLPVSFQQYNQFLGENKVIKGTTDAQLVEKVGNNIKNAAIKWMNSKGMGANIKDYQWQYTLVEDKAANAWCMPGGKIAIFTGILPVTKNEAGLATVMGHEVAHALLAHSRSRIDAAKIQVFGAQILGAATANSKEVIQKATQIAYGVGTGLGTLAYGRSHELEADHLGLILMAIAGYNPQNAIPFWERMSQTSGKTIEFLSTHPNHSTRVREIQKLLPKATNEAKKFGVNFK